MIIVVEGCVIEIGTDRSGGPESMIVRVNIDHERSWLFDEPGWQDIAVGVSGRQVYWWSARHLVVLPIEKRDSDPLVISTDEDICFAFAVSGDWLLVCETSVRLFRAKEETSRLEFGEVLLSAHLEHSRLLVRDFEDQQIEITVDKGNLMILKDR